MDNHIPIPQREVDKPFLMSIESSFNIPVFSSYLYLNMCYSFYREEELLSLALWKGANVRLVMILILLE